MNIIDNALTITLDLDQSEVLSSILTSIKNKQHIGLDSPAGTGKTVLIGHLASELSKRRIEYTATATTHKAAAVLTTKLSEPAITIHSAVGLTLSIDYATGKETFKPSSKGNSKLPYGSVVIVDEASMINIELMQYLIEAASELNLVYIFIGDSKQLPPVQEDISPALSFDPCLTLNKVKRHDNTILNLATHIRQFVGLDSAVSSSDLRMGDYISAGGDITLVRDESEFNAKFDAKLQFEHSDRARLLGWTNKCVSAQSKRVRAAMSLCPTMPEVGETVIFNDAVIRGQTIVIGNNAEHKVLSVKPKRFDIEGTAFDGFTFVTVDQPDVRISSTFDRIALTAGLKKAADKAKYAKNWREYFQIKQQYSSIGFPHSLTIHKSQGSTIDHVFIDYDDISRCRDQDLMMRLLYVAVTRARYSVTFLHRG